MPKVYKGVEQYPLSGVSMRYTFDARPDDPTRKKRQYYAMLGTRGIWENGWMAAALHAPLGGKGHFDKDAWQLYHVDADRSESKDLAKENPDKLKALIGVWFEEADQNMVLPLDDRSAMEILATPRPNEEPPAKGTSTIRGRRRCPKPSRSTCAGVRTRSSRTSRSPIRTPRASSSRMARVSAATRSS